MYGGLGALKEDAMEIGKVGVAALAGASVAKMVAEKVADLKKADGSAMLPAWVAPLAPLAVGVAVHAYGKSRFPLAAPGIAAGMVAVGLGKLAGALAPASQLENVRKYVPFAGVDTYDSGLLAGLGYYDASVNRYMMAGSPTQVQRLMGAPVQVQSLAGLGSTVVNGLAGAPMSAQVLSGSAAAATLM